MGASQSSAAPSGIKSLYQRAQAKKRGPAISDEDLERYTGKSRSEFDAWKATAPGVGGHQRAGTLAMGGASGLAGVAAGAGFGGWGPSAEPRDANRGLKFPPTPAPKKGVEGPSSSIGGPSK
ncbi:hypothetical protein RJ55_02199 [Drechmeria coniospora]|nr:hypothetical protein RJ55_02199 [Drechmeria coniospora]